MKKIKLSKMDKKIFGGNLGHRQCMTSFETFFEGKKFSRDLSFLKKNSWEINKSRVLTVLQVFCGCHLSNGVRICGLQGHPPDALSFATTLEGMWPTVRERMVIM